MRDHQSPAQLGLGFFLAGGIRLFSRCHRRRSNVAGRLCQTSLVVALRARSAFSVSSGVVRSWSVLADLTFKILLLVGGIEHVFVSNIGQNFGSIAEKNDSSRATEFWRIGVKSRVEFIRAIVELAADTRTTEPGWRPVR